METNGWAEVEHARLGNDEDQAGHAQHGHGDLRDGEESDWVLD